MEVPADRAGLWAVGRIDVLVGQRERDRRLAWVDSDRTRAVIEIEGDAAGVGLACELVVVRLPGDAAKREHPRPADCGPVEGR